MTLKFQQRSIIAFAMLVTVTVAILWRVVSAFLHFGHIDDLGVAITIKDTFSYYYDSDTSPILKLKVEEHFGGLLNLIPASMSGLKSSLINTILHSYKAFKLFHAIPSGWTYAPLQFYLTTPLVLLGDSFEQVKFLGRLPSLLFSIASIFFYIHAVRNWLGAGSVFPKAQQSSALLFSVALFSLSHQGIIYSSQMQSYSIALFYVCVFMYLLSREDFLSSLTLTRFSTKAFWSALLFSALISQYQMVTAIIALSGVWIYFIWHHNKRLILLAKFALIFVIAVALSLPYLWTFLLPNLSGAVTWNAGLNGEYLFSPEKYSIGVIFDFARYLIHLTPNILLANLAFVSPDSQVVLFVKWILVLCFAVGVYRSLRNMLVRQAHPVEVFSVCLLCVTIALAFAGKIALSPTRHTLLLVPALSLFITMGVGSLLKPFPASKASHLVLCLALAIAALSFAGIAPFFEARREVVDAAAFLEKIEKYRPDYLATHDSSPSIQLMDEIRNEAHLLDLNTDTSGGVNKPPATLLGKDRSEQQQISILFYSHKGLLRGQKRTTKIHEYVKKYIFREPICMNLSTVQSHSTQTEIDWWPYIPNGANGAHYQLAEFYPSAGRDCV